MPLGHTASEWTCPTCSIGHATNFCPACGEESTSTGHLTLQGFAKQLFGALTRQCNKLSIPLVQNIRQAKMIGET